MVTNFKHSCHKAFPSHQDAEQFRKEFSLGRSVRLSEEVSMEDLAAQLGSLDITGTDVA
jgi:hypothetical protein